MNIVTVTRKDLLDTISANRERHRGQFLQAQQGYRRRVIDELDRMLEDARAGRRFDRYIALPEPEDHTDDYDRVIRMLQMSVDDTIAISSQDFGQYVMDDWSWKDVFERTNSAYGVGAQREAMGARAEPRMHSDQGTYGMPVELDPAFDAECES